MNEGAGGERGRETKMDSGTVERPGARAATAHSVFRKSEKEEDEVFLERLFSSFLLLSLSTL